MNPLPVLPDLRLGNVQLYAWVGENEPGSTEIGLAQAFTPCGLIPLVACKPGKMDQNYITGQLQHSANQLRKPIRLVRFVYAEIVLEINPNGESMKT